MCKLNQAGRVRSSFESMTFEVLSEQPFQPSFGIDIKLGIPWPSGNNASGLLQASKLNVSFLTSKML